MIMVPWGHWHRIAEIYKRDGGQQAIFQIVSYLFNKYIRPLLPKSGGSYRTFNGVLVYDADGRVLDSIPLAGDNPLYEQPIVRGASRHLRKGDKVVIVGGGWGVVSTICGKRVGKNGSVITFEGSNSMYDRAVETTQINEVDEVVEIKHATVGSNDHLWGEAEGADRIPASSLPGCDILILDCEGSEHDIMEEIAIRPRVIIVEIHGDIGNINGILSSRGYALGDSELYLAQEDIWVNTYTLE